MKPPQYTEEVRRALGMDLDQQPEPAVPDGHVRYLIAIHDSQQSGVAPPRVVAAMLRAQADQIDPPRPVMREATP